MDTSEKYILQCEKAFKYIGYIPPDGVLPNVMIPAPDSVYGQEKSCLIHTYAHRFEDIGRESTIPPPIGQLYRQDQLQGMIQGLDFYEFKFRSRSTGWWEMSYSRTIGGESDGIITSSNSFEQLWLGFGMLTKYRRLWSGSEWKETDDIRLER